MQLGHQIFGIMVALCSIIYAEPAKAQNCGFSINSLNFGNIDTLTTANRDVVGNLTVSCSGLVLSRVEGTISIGTGSGGSLGGLRQLEGPGTQLSFHIYRDTARTQIWGNGSLPIGGSGIEFKSSALLLNYAFDVPFFGRVFGGQTTAVPGSYATTFSGANLSVRYRTCTAILCGSYSTVNLVMSVTAAVPQNCLVNATDVNFGTTGSLAAAITTSGNIMIRCTLLTSFQVGLDDGQNSPGAGQRNMKDKDGRLVNYQLFQDNAHTAVWGNMPGSTVGGVGSGGTFNLPVYGRVPAQAIQKAGTYTDIIVVTLTY